MSSDPDLDKIARNRAEQWGCTQAEAVERLLLEARAERLRKEAVEAARTQGDHSSLFAASAFAAVTSIETGLWDRYLLRVQASIRARLATEEYGQSLRARQPSAEEPPQ